MLTVKAIKRKLAPYFARRGEILLAYLFGSVTQGHADKLSDIDLVLLHQAPLLLGRCDQPKEQVDER